MTELEKAIEMLKRIEEIKQTTFNIEVSSDFLTYEEHELLGKLYAEQRQLEEELKNE